MHTMTWLDGFTLVIALSGGIPGIIAWIQHLNRRPNLILNVQQFMTGDMRLEKPDGTNVSGKIFFMTLVLANDGELPILPMNYTFHLYHDAKLLPLRGMRINKESHFSLKDIPINIQDPSERDVFCQHAPITFEHPLIACAMFIITPEIEGLIDKGTEIRAVIRDVYRNEHVAFFALGVNHGSFGPGSADPITGISV